MTLQEFEKLAKERTGKMSEYPTYVICTHTELHRYTIRMYEFEKLAKERTGNISEYPDVRILYLYNSVCVQITYVGYSDILPYVTCLNIRTYVFYIYITLYAYIQIHL